MEGLYFRNLLANSGNGATGHSSVVEGINKIFRAYENCVCVFLHPKTERLKIVRVESANKWYRPRLKMADVRTVRAAIERYFIPCRYRVEYGIGRIRFLDAEPIYGIILKRFFLVLLVKFLRKKIRKIEIFMICSVTQAPLKLKSSPRWVSEKRNDKESMIC